jgi:hypothetical protein
MDATGGTSGGMGGAAGGGMGGGGGMSATVSFKADVAPLMAAKCNDCHKVTAATALAFVNGTAAAGRPCAGKVRNTVILSKINPDTAVMAACGVKMPKMMTAAGKGDAAIYMALKAWIDGGMKNN